MTMGQRYWIVGGDYRDCRFDEITMGTEEVSGPFANLERARTEWTRLSFRDRLCATKRYVITQEQIRV
ncbi:DUF4170 domain-containing protein [Sphingomonas xanthus]|uniref:DUF4170 domain-containing protein n=1 Tax=Sphingomonas xanthus TaxID=2594473 RepID=A0A516IRN9_9SPHN|nr:hypothetical protein [Sphingomonas xanthus]QDP19576.1 hypothetical protein FMM02_06135 [Sphingomonas xanthus]